MLCRDFTSWELLRLWSGGGRSNPSGAWMKAPIGRWIALGLLGMAVSFEGCQESRGLGKGHWGDGGDVAAMRPG